MTKTFVENVIEKMTEQEIVNLAEKIEKETFKEYSSLYETRT